MKKYRIYKAFKGYDIYQMQDEGNGWSRLFHSHYETKEAAEQEMARLKEQEARDEKSAAL